jgi:hypothetical protein
MPPAERLARVAIALAVAGAAIVGATAALVALPDLRASVGLTPAAYSVRQTIDVPRAAYDSDAFTLLIFARSTCEVCQRSSPFLRALAAEAAQAGVGVRLLSSDPVPQNERMFAGALGLADAQVVPVDLKTLRLRRVPTILLVDRQGAIRYAREGAVPAAEQQDVVRTVISVTR